MKMMHFQSHAWQFHCGGDQLLLLKSDAVANPLRQNPDTVLARVPAGPERVLPQILLGTTEPHAGSRQ